MELKTLCELNGVSGNEKAVRNAILEAVRPLCDSASIDRMGSVIAVKKGKKGGNAVLLSAHMDEVGFIIMGATEDGLLRIRPVGGIDPRVAVSKYVVCGDKRVPGVIGAMAIHLQSAEDRKRVLDWDGLYIDIGAKTKDEALADCPEASYAYFDSACEPFGEDMIAAKAIDDRAGCYNLIRLLESTYDRDIVCAFVTQEEAGLRGAMGAGFASDIDTVLVLEGTAANDLGDTNETSRVCAAGAGVAVSFMDKASIADRALYAQIIEIAGKCGVAYQVKRGVTGGNDAGAYQRAKAGKRTCALSVPCRYIHGPSSVASLKDIDAQYQLAKAYIENA